jgi:hypothetical protein
MPPGGHTRVLRRWLAVVMATTTCFMAFAGGATAQTPSPSKTKSFPAPSGLPIVNQLQFVSYWTTETGWASELQLRNNGHLDLTVTPVLRLPDGTETALSAVTVKSQEVKSIDLDHAIGAANAPQLFGAYGSVVLRYLAATRASLYAAMMIRRPGHPIEFHVDATAQWQDLQAGGREGVWWFPQSTANDYLILTNQGGDAIPLNLSIYDAGGHASRQSMSLPSHQTFRYSVRSLVQAAGFAGSFGEITIFGF